MKNDATIHVLGLEMTKLGKPLTLRPVIIDGDDGATLVDTAYPGQYEQLRQAMEEAGIPFSRLKRIIITHQDWDHVGIMKEIIAAGGGRLEIYAHSLEKPYLEGAIPYMKTTPERVAARLATIPAETRPVAARMFAAIPTFKVGRTVEDGEILPFHGGLEVIHTPGHAPGHISLYLKALRVLIPGDELRVDGDRLVGPAPEHTPDMDEAVRSMPKLLGREIDQIICFHGGCYSQNATAAIRELAAR